MSKRPKVLKRNEPPTPEHLKWSIEGREKTQQTTLRLYRVLVDETYASKHEKYRLQIDNLAAASFSLWRAVFLADRELSEKLQHTSDFLAKMLTDNSITFAQDRTNRAWTFNYYAENAYNRLEWLANDWEKVRAALKKRRRKTTTARWDRLQETFDIAVNCLIEEMTGSIKPPRKRNLRLSA